MSELLTVAEVSAVLKCSEDTVVRRFQNLKGVIDIGSPASRDKRRHRVLRIPKTVVEGYLTDKAGKSVKIEVPDRAERRRKSAAWEKRAVLNLAKAAKQNSCTDRKVFARIASNARALAALVPESEWAEIDWQDEEDGFIKSYGMSGESFQPAFFCWEAEYRG